MNKKGQVTIFIIIAIIIVAAVAGYFILKGSKGSFSQGFSEPVSNYVQTCLDNSLEEVVIGIGQGGGYFYPNEFSTDSGVSYYYGKEGVFNFPLKEDIEEEISKVVSEKLVECTNNFTDFTTYDIESRDPEIETEISEEKVKIFVEYPIKITKGENNVVLENFRTEINVKLGLIYGVVEKIIEEEPLKKGICLSCNFNFALESGLNIDNLDYDSTTTIFVIKDEEIMLDGSPYEFIFANDYSEENGI